MTANSGQIVKEVNSTSHLDEALSLIVKRSRSSMGADACSVYIYDTQSDRFVLMAVDGMIPDEIGKVQVSLNEGLVGWVAAHEEVVNLPNAADHPGFGRIHGSVDGAELPDAVFFNDFHPLFHSMCRLGFLLIPGLPFLGLENFDR